MASRWDHIHLDGTNTDKDPYTCQSGASEHPGIYINKSLSLIGSAGPMPQIRCTEGTGSAGLTFNCSDDVEHTNVTLSRILVNGTLVSIQDSSAKIDGCRFEGSKGINFIIRSNYAKTVQTIEIANSTFSRNKECILFSVNSTKSPSQKTQVVFKLTNTSFDANILSNETCISFTESPHSNQSTSFNITLQNVTFSGNKFSSKGLVFLKMENGNHNIFFQNVVLKDNSPLSGRDVLTSEGYSECIVCSTSVDISINSSTFKSQSARSYKIRALNISLQIYDSSFCGQRVEGNGGVISLEGTDLCKLRLSVSNSSFVNTTGAQGGAINIERCNVCSVTFQNSNFTGTTARNGSGGAVYMDAFGYVSNNTERARNNLRLRLIVDGSRFIRCTSLGDYKGGSLYVSYVTQTLEMSINNSYFISNTAQLGGAIVVVEDVRSNSNELSIKNTGQIAIERSTFFNNKVQGYGGAVSVDVYTPTVLVFDKVTMESNSAAVSGAVETSGVSKLKIHQSRFFKNTADADVAGAFGVFNVNFIEVLDSCFDGGGTFQIISLMSRLNFTTSLFTAVFIFNTTFSNCSAAYNGGAIYLFHVGNVSLEVKRCRFVDNFVPRFFGGAIHLELAPDTETNSGCTGKQPLCQVNNTFPTWDYKSNVIFKDTTFERNNAGYAGGAVYI